MDKPRPVVFFIEFLKVIETHRAFNLFPGLYMVDQGRDAGF